ncbi:Asp23/Gls24 family envelope stress response protein [Herbiconiux liangxiaofengii]|uniref:Asp23/Gls24 family envelope stress response protein n=1 Tax=Herbiconiux liangxiaofengii TaxID=3342795 RepID=UPI0035B82749
MSATSTAPIISTTGELGTTVIDQGVVSKVAGIAAHDVAGVHDLGGAATRVIGVVRGALNNTDHSQGVSVTLTDNTVSVDVTLSAEYPISLQKVASDVRSAVILAVETIVGMEVTAVNVTINDIYTPADNGDAGSETPTA